MLEREIYERAVTQSGLTKQELADIYGVSRQQVYNILKGSNPPEQRAARVNLYSRAISKLIELGTLPLPASVKGQQRADAIKKLIRRLYDLARPE